MADRAIPTCRAWLGLDPTDLPYPHRVLGVAEDEGDPLAIVRAADRRFAVLRDVPPEWSTERDALIAQVEVARDGMLAAALTRRPPAAVVPPPVPAPFTMGSTPPTVPPAVPPPVTPTVPPAVPPPTPPAVPPPTPPAVPPPVTPAMPPIGASAAVPSPPPVPPPLPPATLETKADSPFPVAGRCPVSPRRSEGLGIAGVAAALLLVVAVAAVVALVLGPGLRQSLPVARRPTPSRLQPARPDRRQVPASQPRRETPPALAGGSAQEPTTDAATGLQPAPEPDSVAASAPASPQPEPPQPEPPQPEPPQPEPLQPEPPQPEPPQPEPPRPSVDAERIRAQVGAAIKRAFAALRRQEFATASRELEAVAEAALDDERTAARLHGWRQLAVYAAAYPRYRDEALASAAATAATYELGKRQIGVVEVTPRLFIYRDSRNPGRNLRVPRDAIPADIEAALVAAWFARDGRAANHLYLGAAALARPEPDLGAARREWEAAAAGGEADAGLLLGILDDPAARGE